MSNLTACPTLSRRHFLTLLPGLGVLFRPPRLEDPFADPAWFAKWKQAPRHPIWESDNSVENALLAAIVQATPLRIRYLAGSDPGTNREISPALLFTSEGYAGHYLTAHCHERNAPRTFRADLLTLA